MIDTPNKTVRVSSNSSRGSSSYPLNYGTRHADVKILQQYMKKMHNAYLGSYGINKDGIDGHFGKLTKNAAIKHLKKVSFTEEDISGMKTALKFT